MKVFVDAQGIMVRAEQVTEENKKEYNTEVGYWHVIHPNFGEQMWSNSSFSVMFSPLR